jgi:hypothetical protein
VICIIVTEFGKKLVMDKQRSELTEADGLIGKWLGYIIHV